MEIGTTDPGPLDLYSHLIARRLREPATTARKPKLLVKQQCIDFHMISPKGLDVRLN